MSRRRPNYTLLKRNWYKLPRELFLFTNIVLMVFPLYFLFISAMKSNSEFYNSAFSFPKRATENLWNNLEMAWSGKVGAVQFTGFGTMFMNTVILSIVSLIVMLLVALLAGYAMGTKRFKGKIVFTLFILTLQTVPFFGYIMPLYLFTDKLGLTNHLMGVVPIYVAVTLPMTIILLQGFFHSFPAEVEEAALIDGCGEVRKFMFIIIPIARPAIASMAIINFMGYWNEIAIVGLLLNDENLRTINIGVLMTNSQSGMMNYAYVFALLLLSAIPNFIFFSIFQKHIIKGISVGSVKG